MVISTLIKEGIKELGWSLTKLAEKSGVSKSYLSQLMNNGDKNPSHKNVIAIANALGYAVSIYPSGINFKKQAARVCENCRFFKRGMYQLHDVNQVEYDGICTRFPTQRHIVTDFYKKDWLHWLQPCVDKYDTCGEFKKVKKSITQT